MNGQICARGAVAVISPLFSSLLLILIIRGIGGGGDVMIFLPPDHVVAVQCAKLKRSFFPRPYLKTASVALTSYW